MKLITIVIPVYNEAKNISTLYLRLNNVLEPMQNQYKFEILFTDNHSNDETFQLIKALAVKDDRIRALRFSKNFGFQRSIYQGYISAKGEAAIQLDADLQDPPELIPEFVRYWENGCKIVYGIRKKRLENCILTITRKIFYRLLAKLSEINIPIDAGDFRLIDRVILDELRKHIDMQPYLRGKIASFGFKQQGIEYVRSKRKANKSKFNLKKLFGLAFDGIFNHTILPLRIATYFGLSISLLTIIGIITCIMSKLIFDNAWPHGFASTTIILLFTLGLNSLFLGILGEYIGRIYKQVKPESLTIIEDEI